MENSIWRRCSRSSICWLSRELGDIAWRAATRELVTRQGFFQNLRIATYLVFTLWDDLRETFAFTRPPPLGA